jgi:pyruvate-formate lyase-activating enzyme
MQSIKSFISSCGCPERIELLPYHAMGEHKYAALGRNVQIFSTPSKEKMSQLRKIFL